MLRKPDVVPTRQRLLIDCKKYSERTKGNCVLKIYIKTMFLLPNRVYQKGNRNYTTQSNRNSEVKSITKMKILLRGA